MGWTILCIITGLCVVVTLLPLSKHPVWWIRSWDFPRFQLAVVLLLLLGITQLFWRERGAQVALLSALQLACLVYHLWWILPYTRLFPVEVQSATRIDEDGTLRILTANVLTPNRQAPRLIELVQHYRPHLLITLETDLWWEEQLRPLETDYPHVVRCPLENLYGMHVYSQLPLKDVQIQYLVEDDVPSVHAEIELPSGKTVRAHFLHPAPPSPTENEESSERDAELLIVAKSLQGEKRPVVVTGDLNDVAWSVTTRLFRKISGLLDPRVGRGMFNTFHAKYVFCRWPLDHIFHSRHFTLKHMERLPDFGSDHFPVFVELCLQEELAPEQEGLEADAEDRELAQEKINEENVQASDVHVPGA